MLSSYTDEPAGIVWRACVAWRDISWWGTGLFSSGWAEGVNTFCHCWKSLGSGIEAAQTGTAKTTSA